jgi:hypothetical protein
MCCDEIELCAQNVVYMECFKICGCCLVHFFMFSNFYCVDSHNETRVTLANL